jgi:hypothetical protein
MALAIPVQVGSEPYTYWDDIEARQEQHGDDAAPSLSVARRPPLAEPGLDWERLGFEPRWIGDDTADCVAALQPSAFSSQGADEFKRFRQGASSRGELALVVSMIGVDRESDAGRGLLTPAGRRLLSPYDDHILLGGLMCSIASRPLGRGARVQLGDGLGDADRDLGLRLTNCQPGLSWSVVKLQGTQAESVYGSQHYPPVGRIDPILLTPLGETVVGAWVSPDDKERRYVLPAGTPWEVVLEWLAQKALPEYAPTAMRRARAPIAWPPELMTRREREASEALKKLEQDYRSRRDDLQAALSKAREDADQIRDGLLYGTGKRLVETVALVLERAGIRAVDLDAMLGGTRNADLLCTYEGRSRLIEVKSSAGSPGERLYSDLLRHLREWPSLPEATTVDGGALILNHEYNKDPLDRSPEPYTRPEFLASQTEPILATRKLFEAWRDERWDRIQAAIFGPDAETPQSGGSRQTHGGESPAPKSGPVAGKVTSRRWWRRLMSLGRSGRHGLESSGVQLD